MYVRGDFAFYHIPKTGGTSVRKLLLSTGLPFKQKTKDHLPITKWRARRCLKKHKHVYTNVRNPFARLVSLHKFSTRSRKMEFKKFLHEWYVNRRKLDWLKSMEEFLMLDGRIPENITIVKLEEIDEVWPQIMEKHFGAEILAVPRENRTVHHEDPMSCFDEEMIKLVHQKERWACDYYCL